MKTQQQTAEQVKTIIFDAFDAIADLDAPSHETLFHALYWCMKANYDMAPDLDAANKLLEFAQESALEDAEVANDVLQ